MEYPYSAVNRFEQPHSYMYTPFKGVPFLRSYVQSRRECIHRLRQRIADDGVRKSRHVAIAPSLDLDADIDRILDGIAFSGEGEVLNRVLGREEAADFTIDAGKLFRAAASALRGSTSSSAREIREVLSVFVGKFESKKRLFAQYGADLRKRGSDHRSPSQYMALSFALLCYHRSHGDLKFLNAALKIHDLVCSVLDEVRAPDDRTLLHVGLRLELKAFEKLAEEKGVAL